ncbi:hypothetical protein [Flaviaesturariibacter amylovorans]|uniref:DUF202 domain-containing protein n=1 Tax=Flaviaesturariibacter amylovorans TaxID=1084520 RepID=A0ABP8HAF8_9BACT
MSVTEQYEERRRQQLGRARSLMNYVMGTVFCAFGAFFVYVYLTKTKIIGRPSTVLDLVIGLLVVGYGIWRIYRGYKKNYFNE